MDVNYVIEDEKGNVIQSTSAPQGALPVQQGETKSFSVFLYNENGTPFVMPTVTELALEIFSMIGHASITKKFSLSQVTLIASATLGGDIGFKFSLTGADTGNMAVNNAGLGMSMAWTDGSANVSNQDFAGIFSVTAPLVGLTSEGD